MAKEDNLSAKERTEVKEEISKAAHKQLFEQAKRTRQAFKQEFKQQTAAAIIAAFGFLIALVWKDIITNSVNGLISLLPSLNYPVVSTIISAVLVTAVCVVGIILINRWAKKTEANN